MVRSEGMGRLLLGAQTVPELPLGELARADFVTFFLWGHSFLQQLFIEHVPVYFIYHGVSHEVCTETAKV